MKVSKRIIIPAIGVTMAGSLYGINRVSAAVSPNRKSLVQDLADDFHHASPAAASPAASKRRPQFGQNREADYEQRLQAAVAAGQLTAAQQAAILAEHNKLQAELQTDLGNDPTNHAAALQQLRSEATAWASANGVDASWLLPTGGFGRRRSNGATTTPMAPAPQPQLQ